MALSVHKRSFQAGQLILLEGEPSRAVYLIVAGEVRIQRSSQEGREYVLHTLGPGQCFNLVSALDGGYNLATASAWTRTVALVIPRDVFYQMVRHYPKMAQTLLQHLAGRVRLLSDAAEDLAFYPVRTRLARCLLSSVNGDALPARHWTQDELAAQVGTVRDVVGRALRTLTQEGLIRSEHGRVVVTDVAGLRREALCEQDPRYAGCMRM
jgi:CRP-like cAMP-binding protein